MKLWSCVLHHELGKVFADGKLVRSMFVLPILLVLVTSLLGAASGDTASEQTRPVVYVLDHAQYLPKGDEIGRVVQTGAKTPEELEADRTLQPEDVVLKFHEQGATVYYNGSNAISRQIGQLCCRQLQQDAFSNLAAANAVELSGRITVIDADEGKNTGRSLFSVLFPYLLVLSLFQDISSFSIDTVAGEKERGIFEKTLLAPVSPVPVLLGKAACGTICGLLSSGIYLLVVASFSHVPRFDIFGFREAQLTQGQLLLVCLCAVSLSVLFAGLSLLCSLLSRTVAEARSLRLPVYGITIVLALASMLRVGTSPAAAYLIPIYNVCILLQDMGNTVIRVQQVVCTVGSLLACSIAVLLVMLLSLKRERVRC